MTASPALAFSGGAFGFSGRAGTTPGCAMCHGFNDEATTPVLDIQGLNELTAASERRLSFDIRSNTPDNDTSQRLAGFAVELFRNNTDGTTTPAIGIFQDGEGIEVMDEQVTHDLPAAYRDGVASFEVPVNFDTPGDYTLYIGINDSDGDGTNRCVEGCNPGQLYDLEDLTANIEVQFTVAPQDPNAPPDEPNEDPGDDTPNDEVGNNAPNDEDPADEAPSGDTNQSGSGSEGCQTAHHLPTPSSKALAIFMMLLATGAALRRRPHSA